MKTVKHAEAACMIEECETKLLFFHYFHVSIIFSFYILIIFIKTFPFDLFNPELLVFFAFNECPVSEEFQKLHRKSS